MKKTIAMLLALVMVFALCACGGSSAPAAAEAPAAEAPAAEAPAEAPAAEGSVYWLNFKPESDQALQELAAMYTEETGVPVKVVTAASGTYNETLTAEMDKSNPPTLFVVGNQAAVDTWGDYCLDLTGAPVTDELNTNEYMLYDADGKLCSIGYCYECYGIIVNKALLAEAGHDISEITNFDSLKAVVEDITARKDELGFSAFTSAGMDGSSSWRFTGHVANLEYYYESVDNPDAWKSCPAELTGAYMQNYRNLLDLMFENSTVDRSALAAGGFDANAEFANGEAAFYVNGSWAWNDLQASMKAEDLAMIPYYCGVEGEEKAALNCGTENYWAVNCEADEADIQATLDFLYWLVTSETGTTTLADTMGFDIPFKAAKESTNYFKKVAAESVASGKTPVTWNFTTMPSETWKNGVGAALTDYAQGTGDWDAVVTAFVDNWATEYAAAN